MNPEASSATRATRVITKACGSRSLDSLRLGIFAMSFGGFTVYFHEAHQCLQSPNFAVNFACDGAWPPRTCEQTGWYGVRDHQHRGSSLSGGSSGVRL